MPATDSSSPRHDLIRLVEVLDRHQVEYLLVGGAAARAYGAKRPTEDAACGVRRERTNLDRLAGAMRELNARLRVHGITDDEARELPVQLDGKMLASAEISTWMTDAGGLDVLSGLTGADALGCPTRTWSSEQRSSEGLVSRCERRLCRTTFRPKSTPIDRKTATR